MKKRIIGLCFLMAGCSSQQVTYEEHGTYTDLGHFPLIEWPLGQPSPVKRLVIDQGIPKSAPIVVASFANIDHLTEVSSLGRYLSEFFVNDLVAYGYPVYDLEAQDEIMLIRSLGAIYRTREGHLGDGLLTQTIKEPDLLAKGVRYVLTGTYTELDDRIIVQARLIDISDAKIASTLALSLARRDMIAELSSRKPRGKRLEVVGP